ncbi:MAG: cupin domain-containing protein [Gemmatimonadales bacterium]
MDLLSDILATLRLQGTLYFHTDFRPPWGLRVPQYRRVARFHLAVRGECWVRVEGAGPPFRLEAGDLALITRGAEHVLADTPDTPCRTVDQVVRESGFTGKGALVVGAPDAGSPTRLVCGHFAFDEEFRHPFLDQLPPAIVIRADDYADNPSLDDAFQLVAREVRAGRPGGNAVVTRLSEILFVQAVRHWFERAAADTGVVAAMNDPGLGKALGAMHAEPAAAWTLELLGRTAAMGRTAFAARFREIVGMTPMEYLTTWRIQLGKRLLGETRLSLDQIAARVGYESSASFSRVFTREAGERPGAYRRRTGGAGLASV